MMRVHHLKANKTTKVVMNLPFAPSSAAAVDLAGNVLPGVPLAVEGNGLRLSLAPAQIVTLRLGGPA